MASTEKFEELQRRIEALERRLAEAESRSVLRCSELHIVDADGKSVITLSVNENGAGEIRVESVHGMSGVHICGEDDKGGGFLEVFKQFTEILDPCILPRKDAIRLGIQDEDLGGGGTVCTFKNYVDSVTLGSRYGYGGFVSVNGETDSSERVLLGVDRQTDAGVILLKTVKNAEDPKDDPDDFGANGLKTLVKLGKGAPPRV